MLGTFIGTSYLCTCVKLKHIHKDIGGRYYFQKRWPQDLLPAMKAAGRGTKEKRRLDVGTAPSEVELASALASALDQHEQYLAILRATGTEELEAIELRKKALVWLKQHGIEPGCWYTGPNSPMSTMNSPSASRVSIPPCVLRSIICASANDSATPPKLTERCSPAP